MAFQKNKITKFGFEAGYWTLISCTVRAFPQGVPYSTVVYGLFASRESYNEGVQPLEVVHFEIPYSEAIPMAYPILPNLEQYIRNLPGNPNGQDENGNLIIEPNFFADAASAEE